MGINLDQVKAICFDVDGTLRDTDDNYVLKFQRYLHPFRFLFPKQDTAKFSRWLVMAIESPGNFFFEIPDHLDLDDDIAQFQAYMRSKRKNNREHETLIIKGVEDTLEKMYGVFPMCVVSARPAFGTYQFLTQHNLQKFFIEVAHGQTTRYTKPHADPIIWCAEKMGCKPEEILMVGDTRPDILAAKNAGAQCVGVLSGFGTEKELIRLGADLILDDVTGLLTLFADKLN
jgi:HAD superfamily hydrolase (TIGR01549 family)